MQNNEIAAGLFCFTVKSFTDMQEEIYRNKYNCLAYDKMPCKTTNKTAGSVLDK